MDKKKLMKIIGGIIGVALVITILVIAVANSKGENSSTNKESTAIMDKFYKYMESKKAKVIYFGSATCSYCSLETPIMKQIKKDYKLDYLYIDKDKLSKSDLSKIIKQLDIEGATPTIAIVKNDGVVEAQEGYLEGKEMVKFLIKNKVLKNDAVYTPEEFITDISYSDYEEIIKKDEMSVIVIGQTTCSHCIATKPVLNHIAEDYDVTINYLNLTNMDSEEQEKLTESLKEIGYEDAENLGTPLTLIVKSNHLEEKIEGENPTSYYLRKFRSAGLINDDDE